MFKSLHCVKTVNIKHRKVTERKKLGLLWLRFVPLIYNLT